MQRTVKVSDFYICLGKGFVMQKKILYVIDDGNTDKKIKMLQEQILPENLVAEVTAVPRGCNKATYYNEVGRESEAEYTIYLNGDFCICDTNMTLMLLETLRHNKDAALVGLHGTNKFSVDLCQWQNDFANFPVGVYTAKIINSTVLATSKFIPWRENTGLDDGLLYMGYVIDVQKQNKKTVVLAHKENYLKNEIFSSLERDGIQVFQKIYGKDLLPLVSVLIPTYNRRDLFSLALKSVLEQDYPNLEIIVSDDGTNDETEKYIQPYLKDEKLNIKYKHHKNFTFKKNWLWLLENFHGEYFNFLMDDDLFAPNKISRMVSGYITNPNVVLVTSYRQFIDINGNYIMGHEPLADIDTIFDGKDIIKKTVSSLKNFIGEPTTVLLHKRSKSIMKEYIQENSAIIDVKTSLKILETGDLLYISEPLSFFRVHKNQDQRSLERIIDSRYHWLKLFSEYTQNEKYLSREEAGRTACDVIVPNYIEPMELFCKILKNKTSGL